MYSRTNLALKYLRYYLTASNGEGHGIHSPFVFEFITEILNDKNHYPAYAAIEKLRQNLLDDKTLLTIDDLGAGSANNKSNQRTIASITKNTVKSKKYGQLLYRIVKKYQPQNILELGTSLGITTSYLAAANPNNEVITIEGSDTIANNASGNFNFLKLLNIQLIQGNFDTTLSPAISQLPTIDLAFIDGNHRKEPTIKYFSSILTKANNFSIIAMDDIHWSREMEKAWDYCKNHELVTLSIDLFFIGLLFFRTEIRGKQHFVIRF